MNEIIQGERRFAEAYHTAFIFSNNYYNYISFENVLPIT